MFKNFWKMSDGELKKLAKKHNLRHFLEEDIVFTENRKVDTDFVINRKDIIEQLLQRDNRNIASRSTCASVLGAVVSLLANIF